MTHKERKINTNNKSDDGTKDTVKCYLSAHITIKDIDSNKVILKKRGWDDR